ncbi:hypothetical protein AC249_AIPGENE2841 [Exaiptasia diaphana]|nr:hypothetical protein AC249_AIPGENE2841 [Exaiptasia diaphana]
MIISLVSKATMATVKLRSLVIKTEEYIMSNSQTSRFPAPSLKVQPVQVDFASNRKEEPTGSWEKYICSYVQAS